MKGTALVTGCAGFIGSHLTDRLLASGYKVIGIDNFRSGTKSNMTTALSNPNFTFIEEDITASSFGESITEKLDYVFHLAAIVSVSFSTKNPIAVDECNVRGTLNILELARKHEVKRFVFSSSCAVYGDPDTLPVQEDFSLNPLSPYAASKIAGEYYIKSYEKSFGLNSVILRLFNVYGPRQDSSDYGGVIAIFLNRATKGDALMIEGDGLQRRSFIHVDDVVHAILRAAEVDGAKGEIINLSSNVTNSVIEVAQQIREMTGVEIIHVEPRVGDIRDSIGDMTKATEILGAEITVPLKEGLEQTLAWYRNPSAIRS